MIKVDVLENFPITAILVDEATGTLVTGETVYYDIRNIADAQFFPPINGTLTESTVEAGVYKTSLSLPQSGNYICYVTADTFLTSTEEIIVNAESMYNVVKQGYHYNLSVEDVIRDNQDATASQIARNVPRGRTDYIITRIKNDDDLDWAGVVTSGIVYAHYRDTNDKVPYKVGGPF